MDIVTVEQNVIICMLNNQPKESKISMGFTNKDIHIKEIGNVEKEVPEEIMSGASSDNGNKVNTKDIEIRSTMALLELMF